MKILINANIALDVLLKRHPYYIPGMQILGLSKGGAELFVSASTITDLYYIINKQLSDKKAAINLIKNLLISVNIAAITNNEIYRAIDLEWNDFEDAVQYAAGETILMDYLVTRNTTDFMHADIPVVTPDEMLNILMTS